MRLRGLLIVASIAALLLIWVGWRGHKQVMWQTPTGRGVAQIIHGAASVNETLLTPPQAYRNIPITAAEMSVLSRTAHRKLADYYTGAPLKNWRQTARRALNPADLHYGKTSAWMMPWRMDWFHLGELALLPRSATATASAQFRSNTGVLNRLDYTFHLVKTAAGWRVDDDQFRFESGSGP